MLRGINGDGGVGGAMRRYNGARASLHMVMSLLLCINSEVIYVILLRRARRSPQAPDKGTLVIAPFRSLL